MLIIDRILLLLEEKKIKSIDLCNYLNINNSTFTNWKQRKTDPPAKYIKDIAIFFDIPVDLLLTGKIENNNISAAKQKIIEYTYRLDDQEAERLLKYIELFHATQKAKA